MDNRDRPALEIPKQKEIFGHSWIVAAQHLADSVSAKLPSADVRHRPLTTIEINSLLRELSSHVRFCSLQSTSAVGADVGAGQCLVRLISSARALSRRSKKKGRHSDGNGLYLSISDDGDSVRRRWIFLYRWLGKLTEMGLGGLNSVTLARARELATECRSDLAAGINPKEKRDAARTAAAGVPTFGEAADAYIAAMEGGWRNAKHRKQWRNTLRDYAAPLRAKLVDAVTTEDVLRVLQPIWQVKQETASRVRGRIENVLDAARALGHIAENAVNPARWRGHLDKLLSKRKKLARGHHPAMPYADVPNFMEQLRWRPATSAMLLEFIS